MEQGKQGYNVVIISRDASPTSFQVWGTFEDVRQRVAKLADDTYFYKLVESDPVFVSCNGGQRAQYTIGELVRG